MEAFNCCCLYVQAIYLSDIAEPSGARLLSDLVEVKMWNCSNLIWPLQLRPSKYDCLVWKRLLMKFLLNQIVFGR